MNKKLINQRAKYVQTINDYLRDMEVCLETKVEAHYRSKSPSAPSVSLYPSTSSTLLLPLPPPLYGDNMGVLK